MGVERPPNLSGGGEMVGRPKGPKKKVFCFRADPALVDMWRAYASVLDMSVDDLGKQALEMYIDQNPLTEDQRARLDALLAIRDGGVVRSWPVIIDRGQGLEKVYYPSEDDRQRAIDAYKAQGVKIVMLGAVELIVRGGEVDE